MAKKEEHKRVCGFCHKPGHNVRSCGDRKAAEASAGGSQETVSTSTAMVPANPVGDEAQMSVPGKSHMPVEFEEASKQVHVNGTSLRLSLREFDTGIANLTLRFQTEAYGAKDIALDIEVASKLYELLGWALQRQAAKMRDSKLQPAKLNGSVQKTA